MNHIGIDVSGKALSIVISVNGKQRKAQSYENTPEDHKRLVVRIPRETLINSPYSKTL